MPFCDSVSKRSLNSPTIKYHQGHLFTYLGSSLCDIVESRAVRRDLAVTKLCKLVLAVTKVCKLDALFEILAEYREILSESRSPMLPASPILLFVASAPGFSSFWRSRSTMLSSPPVLSLVLSSSERSA
jgi:hypothetical protein